MKQVCSGRGRWCPEDAVVNRTAGLWGGKRIINFVLQGNSHEIEAFTEPDPRPERNQHLSEYSVIVDEATIHCVEVLEPNFINGVSHTSKLDTFTEMMRGERQKKMAMQSQIHAILKSR